MGTTRTFSAMLNEYLPNELLKEELVKRTWLLENVEKDNNWKGGNLIVPFKGAGASSVQFGGLTAANDVAEDVYVRGQITSQPEVWGTMIFNHRDLMEHNKLSEQSFLKILPDTIEDFMEYMKMVVSLSLLNGPHFATLTGDGDASGNITVDRPERLVIGQKVYVDDDDSSAQAGYVRTINMNTGVATIYDARSGGSVVDLSGYTTAQNAKVYFDGNQTSGNRMTDLRASLLSNANGGSASLYGQTKTAYPYLQAQNIDGSGFTAATILNDIFDAQTQVRNRGKGMPDRVVMSWTNLGYVMKALEDQKGTFHIDPKSTKVNAYGWTEIHVFGVKGQLKIVGIQELDDDVMYILDMRALKFYSNGFFRKRQNPDDGREFFEQRATTGYSYLVDICLFGDLVLLRPSYCGIVYDVPDLSA